MVFGATDDECAGHFSLGYKSASSVVIDCHEEMALCHTCTVTALAAVIFLPTCESWLQGKHYFQRTSKKR